MIGPRLSGYSLAELLLVLAVVALLSSLVYPRYADQVVKIRRIEATTALLETAHALERCRARWLSYDADGCGVSGRVRAGFSTPGGHYRLSGSVASLRFELRAEPRGVQARRDRTCATFVLDYLGVREVTGSADGKSSCW